MRKQKSINSFINLIEISKIVSFQSSATGSKSTPNSKIWEPLVLADQIKEVSESCQKGVLQRGENMAHVVGPPLLLGRISKCEYPLAIECQTIGINPKQQDLGACGLG